MKTPPQDSERKESLALLDGARPRNGRSCNLCASGSFGERGNAKEALELAVNSGAIQGKDVRVICIYPTVHAGNLARQWIEQALQGGIPLTASQIEYFNYEVLSHDSISWEHLCERIGPDIILIVGDGDCPLNAGLRSSLRDLFSQQHKEKRPLVLFRDLEDHPSLSTLTILDYLSALTRKHECELHAMNGNGGPISCFRHPPLLLKKRRHHE